jgi:hypothetical protein
MVKRKIWKIEPQDAACRNIGTALGGLIQRLTIRQRSVEAAIEPTVTTHNASQAVVQPTQLSLFNNIYIYYIYNKYNDIIISDKTKMTMTDKKMIDSSWSNSPACDGSGTE